MMARVCIKRSDGVHAKPRGPQATGDSTNKIEQFSGLVARGHAGSLTRTAPPCRDRVQKEGSPSGRGGVNTCWAGRRVIWLIARHDEAFQHDEACQ
jgi:hypothetical protein